MAGRVSPHLIVLIHEYGEAISRFGEWRGDDKPGPKHAQLMAALKRAEERVQSRIEELEKERADLQAIIAARDARIAQCELSEAEALGEVPRNKS